MKTFKVCLVIALVFLAGVVAGSVATRAVTRRAVARVLSNPDQLRFMIEKRLARRLRLDAEQRQKVDDILARKQGELRALRRQFLPQFQLIMSNTQDEISALLTREQRSRFEAFREENRALWQPR